MTWHDKTKQTKIKFFPYTYSIYFCESFMHIVMKSTWKTKHFCSDLYNFIGSKVPLSIPFGRAENKTAISLPGYTINAG